MEAVDFVGFIWNLCRRASVVRRLEFDIESTQCEHISECFLAMRLDRSS